MVGVLSVLKESAGVMEKLILGIDFGTDSVRTVVISAETGKELANEVAHYSRWSQGRYCDPGKNQFRQHPLDYTEGLEGSQFVIRNPNAVTTCGCGSSFST